MLQCQHFGGHMEYGRSVLLRVDPCPRHRHVQPTVFTGNRHRPEDSTFQPADRAEWSAVPVQITLTNKKAGKQCQSKSLILPGGRLESV